MALIAYFLADVYSTTKRTVENGKLSYPFLFRAGIVLALILAVANVTSYNRPIVVTPGLVAALGFILIFTVLPVFALGLHSLLRMRSYMKTKSGGVRSYGWYLALLGILLGALALLSVVLRPGSIPVAPVTTPTLTKQLIPRAHAVAAKQPDSSRPFDQYSGG